MELRHFIRVPAETGISTRKGTLEEIAQNVEEKGKGMRTIRKGRLWLAEDEFSTCG